MLILAFIALLILLPLALRLRGKDLPALFISVAFLFVSLIVVVAIWNRLDPEGVVRAIIPGIPDDPMIHNTFYTTDFVFDAGLNMTVLWIIGAGLVWGQSKLGALYFPRLQELSFWGLTLCFAALFLFTSISNIAMTWFDDDMDGIARSVELLQAVNTASTITAPIMLLSALLLLGLLVHATVRRILHGPVEN